MKSKKTLVLGATPNPERYAYMAAQMLLQRGYPIVLVGIKRGEVFGQKIIQDKTQIFADIHTITLYVGRANQPEWYDYILWTKPKRLIFNPNAENPELEKLSQNAGIECLHACTLVLLRTGQY